MERQHTIAGSPEVHVLVRVRGMSHEQRFFDEQTTTTRLTRDFAVIILNERVDLDAEVHMTNMRTQVGGTYRVAWTSSHTQDGSYHAGLELLDPEGEIWEEELLMEGGEKEDVAIEVLLACARCGSRVSTTLPEAENAALGEGFTIARHCDACKATTGWTFCVEQPSPSAVAASANPAGALAHSAATPSGPLTEHRLKGRAPIKLGIKITRMKYGMPTHDVGETINVSRTGAYFTTNQSYEPGEIIEVILPYHPDGLQIPVKARVIRQDEREGTYQKRVAIQLLTGTPTLP